MPAPEVTVVHARGALDVDSGDVVDNAYVVVEEGRITSVGDDGRVTSDADEVVELPELTLLPGLMDMEVDLVLGGPGAGSDRSRQHGSREDDAARHRQRSADVACRVHDRAQPRPVRQDRRLPGRRRARRGHRGRLGRRSADRARRSRDLPDRRSSRSERAERSGAGHHADDASRRASPTASTRSARRCATRSSTAPSSSSAARRAVSMTPTGPPGAQQYSTEELAAIADEAHRRGLRVATHCHGDTAVNAAIDAGIDCIEHGMMITDDTIQRMVDTGTFLVSTSALTENWDISEPAEVTAGEGRRGVPEGEGVAVEGDRGRREGRAAARDAPAIWHGRNAEELDVLVQAGDDADPGDPRRDDRRRRPHRQRPSSAGSPPRCSPTSSASSAIRSPTSRRSSGCRFVMKDGKVHKRPG